ncbi:hypothetical protein V2G26_015564 [Clonostachys chloroleuca]
MTAKLCDKCFVIQFNDKLLEPHVVKEVVKQDGESPTLSLPLEEYHKVLLDYHVIDTLPELPLLSESANLGCGFCSLLRHEIIRAGFDYHGSLEIRLAYAWGDEWHSKIGLGTLVAELKGCPDIPSILPASPLYLIALYSPLRQMTRLLPPGYKFLDFGNQMYFVKTIFSS